MRRRQMNQRRRRRLQQMPKREGNIFPPQSEELQSEKEQSPQYQPTLDGLSDPHSLSSVSQKLESDEQTLILEELESEKIDPLLLNQSKQSFPVNQEKVQNYILYPENGM